VKLGADQENPAFARSSVPASVRRTTPYGHTPTFPFSITGLLFACIQFTHFGLSSRTARNALLLSLWFSGRIGARTFNGIGLPGRARPESAIHGGKLYLHYGVSNAAALAERIRYDLGCGRLAGAATSSLARARCRTAAVAPSAPKKANPFLRNWRRGG